MWKKEKHKVANRKEEMNHFLHLLDEYDKQLN